MLWAFERIFALENIQARMKEAIKNLQEKIQGKVYDSDTMKVLYATDASAYREMPTAVVLPEIRSDLVELVNWARETGTSLIPRTAGTSLAGQVVGNGVVVDVSKHFTKVLEVNAKEKWVRVEPGVVRDELNMFLKDHGLFFGPETSTSNRCMIGGMVGNNSCGARSVIYGSVRDHLQEVECILADGSITTFKQLTKQEYQDKVNGKTTVSKLEHEIYLQIDNLLKNKKNQELIHTNFPKPSIPRRNTGYAIDLLALSEVFDDASDNPFNFCNLIAGSEGTLAFITEIKLGCVPVPPKYTGVSCVHFHDVIESLRGNIVALKHGPSAVELMDHYILDCTKGNLAQEKNRFFVDGDPKAVLIVEFQAESPEGVLAKHEKMIKEMQLLQMGYHYPLIQGDDVKRVWDLRKAGLGLLANIPGDDVAVPVIEDTAVDTNDLPDFIAEFNEILKANDLYCVHYAHAGSGELHLRPVLNMKTKFGHEMFRKIATEIATLVKKYKGSLSGEHGDGRLRGEFIPFMIGQEAYNLVKEVKKIWDKNNVFNPGKIVDTAPMDSYMRYEVDQETRTFNTVLNFDKNQGIVRATELCNGSADCRKTELSGGTMCPSYMVTREEKHTTRARANILRETLTRSQDKNPFASKAVKEVMDLCLSCKGCKAECPSSVDVAKLKSEWQHQYYKTKGIPLRSAMMAKVTKTNQIFSHLPGLYNFGISNPLTGPLIKKAMGVARQRSLPKLAPRTLNAWYKSFQSKNGIKSNPNGKKVYFFADEFTNYNDVQVGKKAIKLLMRLGYSVEIPEHTESGRTYLSKGLLDDAKLIANLNISFLGGIVNEDQPIVGVEPSAILTLRDEYLDLCDDDNSALAQNLADNTFLIEEFLADQIDKGHINQDQFTEEKKLIKVHGHCHQKALSTMVAPKKMLSLPKNYEVHMIQSGCCGMAGSFGYEKEHYDVSMKIGELALFPAVRKQPEEVLVAAAGTSCRHQIKDGTSRDAMHPVEILFDALAH